MRGLNELLSLVLAVCAAPRKSNSPKPDKCVVGFTSPRVRNERRLRRGGKRNSAEWLLGIKANGLLPKGVAISAPMKWSRVTLPSSRKPPGVMDIPPRKRLEEP